jgi:hypothetical protein
MGRAIEGLVVGLAVTAGFMPVSPALVERWFSVSFYPNLQRVVTPLSNAVPFAVLDVLTILLLLAVIIGVLHVVGRTRQTRSARPLLRMTGHVAAAAAVVYLVFLFAWGLNYRRLPMHDRIELSDGPPAPDAVLGLARQAVERLNVLHGPAHRTGWETEPWLNAPLLTAFQAVQPLVGHGPGAVPARLKPSIYGRYFRWSGVDGMINPFALEALANPDLLPFERPFVAAHEWAHLAGYADEAEASFVGWLTCLHADAAAEYSGWLYVYWQVNAALRAGERELLGRRLDPGPARDIEAVASRLRRGESPRVRKASRAVYDTYLKANRVDEGIGSYGEVVSLIARARFSEGWTPVRRD